MGDGNWIKISEIQNENALLRVDLQIVSYGTSSVFGAPLSCDCRHHVSPPHCQQSSSGTGTRIVNINADSFILAPRSFHRSNINFGYSTSPLNLVTSIVQN
jgi:hypothetical protein